MAYVRGKTNAVRYTNKQGNISYYTADGNSMRKAFIRTPVDFARISSRFSMGRKHPILNKIRAHKGVDTLLYPGKGLVHGCLRARGQVAEVDQLYDYLLHYLRSEGLTQV